MENLIKKSIEKIKLENEKIINNDLKLIINNKNYISIPLSKNNFYSIERKQSKKRFAFFDGGNQNIYSNSNISIDVIRIYFCIFLEDKKVKSKKYDFLSITKTKENESKEIIYINEILCNEDIENEMSSFEKKSIFNPKDETLKNGIFDIKINEIASKIRRYLELFLSTNIINNHLEQFETIILDGTLQETIVNEKKFMDKLKKASEDKNILVLAISKSTNVYTNTSLNYDELLIFKAKETNMKRFVYFPSIIVNSPNHDVEIYFAKFHERNNLVLRIEMFKKDSKFVDITKLFSQIAFFAKDPILLGYPYGLIDADKFARITNQETEYLKTIFLVNSKKESQNLHNILDSISF